MKFRLSQIATETNALVKRPGFSACYTGPRLEPGSYALGANLLSMCIVLLLVIFSELLFRMVFFESS